MERNTKINITASLRALLFKVRKSFFIIGLLCITFSLPATASYLPFNTSVDMKVGIGTATPEGGLVVMNGGVGIGTWVPINGLGVVSNEAIGESFAGRQYAPANGLIIEGNVGVGTWLPTASLEIGPGTAATPPIQLNSGTSLTTAAAGSIEFDGTAFYATSAASSRQVVRADQFIDISSSGTFTLANVNTAQKIFSNVTTNGALTVQGSTLYFFEGQYLLSEGTGANHTTQVAFALGGGASLTSINYTVLATPSAANTETATTYSTWVNQATVTSVTASAQPANLQITFQGAMRVNAGGTITPEIQFNNAPGGTGTVNVDTYFRIWPVGSNTTQSQGNWS